MGKVLLDLDTLVVRPRISIDGESYEIMSPDELPVLTSHALSAKGKRMDELAHAPELAEEEERELAEIVRSMSDTIMEPVPAEIRAKLSDAHRLSVIQAFSALLLNTKATAAAALMTALRSEDQSTGEKTSPDSSDSTAGSQTGGSAKPRSRS